MPGDAERRGRTSGGVEVAASRAANSDYLAGKMGEGDFVDCYSAPASVSPRVAIEEITRFPAWVRGLLLVRKALIAAPFGLSNDGPEAEDKFGAFPLVYESADEIVAGFDDKHLDFLVSARADGATISLTTWVRCHGWPGRAYLFIIMPFHILVARNAVARVARLYPAKVTP